MSDKLEKKEDSFHVRQLKARLKNAENKLKRVTDMREEMQEQSRIMIESNIATFKKAIAKASK